MVEEEDGLVLPAAALAEAKALLRAADAGEDALIAELLESAALLCERFTGQALLARGFRETIGGAATDWRRSRGWHRLGRSPVRAITLVEAIDGGGAAVALAPADYAIDLDSNGDGWVRPAAPAARLRVRFEAGMAAEWPVLPAPLRHGILRLAAHLYTFRTDAGAVAEPPAAVTALWRPYRRLRLG